MRRIRKEKAFSLIISKESAKIHLHSWRRGGKCRKSCFLLSSAVLPNKETRGNTAAHELRTVYIYCIGDERYGANTTTNTIAAERKCTFSCFAPIRRSCKEYVTHHQHRAFIGRWPLIKIIIERDDAIAGYGRNEGKWSEGGEKCCDRHEMK